MADERKEVLRGFLASNGGHAAVVAKFNLTQSQASYLSQLTAKDSTASFGERSAKNWEGRLKMPNMSLVQPITAIQKSMIGKIESSNVSRVPMGITSVPLISFIQAGTWTEVVDNFQTGDAEDWLMTDVKVSTLTFALEIKGYSMLPEFNPGDRVIIDPDVAPLPGDFVAAKNGKNEATFKKYRPRGTNEHGDAVFELVPLNEDFPSMRSDVTPIKIVGTMVEHRKFRKTR